MQNNQYKTIIIKIPKKRKKNSVHQKKNKIIKTLISNNFLKFKNILKFYNI